MQSAIQLALLMRFTKHESGPFTRKNIYMICGNAKAQQLLQQCLDQSHRFPFLILHGPLQVGKTIAVMDAIDKILGPYKSHDFLHIKDLSRDFDKTHILKVDSDELITLKDDSSYIDRGAKQIRERLTTSSLSGHKIVLIESIERANPSTANALLKSLEEPLPGRIVIATTQNKDSLLETIISRATLIPFYPVDQASIIDRIQQELPHIAPFDVETLSYFAGGKPGRIKALLQDPDSTEQLKKDFVKLQKFRKGNKLTPLYKLLQAIDKAGNLNLMSEAWIKRMEDQKDFIGCEFVSKQLRLIDTNISKDTILFSLARGKSTTTLFDS